MVLSIVVAQCLDLAFWCSCELFGKIMCGQIVVFFIYKNAPHNQHIDRQVLSLSSYDISGSDSTPRAEAICAFV